MGHYVPEGTGEGLCDLSQAGSDTVVNDWKDWRPDTAIKAGTRCSVKMTGSMTGAVLLTVESVLPGSQVLLRQAASSAARESLQRSAA